MGKLVVAPSRARTFALVGHRSSGKTSLAEAMLQRAGVIRRAGRVDEGTTLLDHLSAERRRHMSLQSGFAWFEHAGHMLFLIDVPGGAAAAPERQIAGDGADLRVVVVGANDGVEQGTRRELTGRDDRPLMAVVTKLDRCHPHEWKTRVDQLQSLTARRVQPLQIPYYDEEGELSGVIDLVGGVLVGSDGLAREIPARAQRAFAANRETLVEAVALGDDTLLESYLEFFELDDALLEEGLARAVTQGRLLPVCFASVPASVGAGPLLDVIARYGPAPIARAVPLMDADGAPVVASEDGPFAAQLLATQLDNSGAPVHILRVWNGSAPARGQWEWEGGRRGVRRLYGLRGPRRAVAHYTGPGAIIATWEPLGIRPGDVVYQGGLARPARSLQLRPAIERRLHPRNHNGGGRLETLLEALRQRDRGAAVRRDTSGSAILGGVNSAHLERLLEQLQEDIEVDTSLPMVPYRESPLRPATGEYEHNKLVGGEPLEFARVELALRPVRDSGLRFKVDAHPEDLPAQWHGAIERGVRAALRAGPRAGYPVDGLEVVCTGGAYDLFASEESWFEIAAAEALRCALELSSTELIEPLFEVVVEVPSACVGDVLTELGHRDGRVIGLEAPGLHTRISAEIPYRQLRTLGPRLEAVTRGESRLEAAQRRMAPVPERAVAQALHESPYVVPQRRNVANNAEFGAVVASPG